MAAAVVVAVFLVTTPIVGVLSAASDDSVRQLALLASPSTLVAGIGQWWFAPAGESAIGAHGLLYGLSGVALFAGCVLLLLARYRKVAR